MAVREFHNKVVLITGGSRGLGLGIGKAFAAQGARIVIFARQRERLNGAVSELRLMNTECLGFCCDVQDSKLVAQRIRDVEESFGAVDILINNAMHYVCARLEDMSPEDWDKQIAVSLNGAFYCTRYALPSMIRRGHGHIINIASSAIHIPIPTFSAYAAAKAGMVAMTRTLSEEVKLKGIFVNAVVLGMTDTEKTRERINKEEAITVGLEEMITVEEAAEVVLFLASSRASAIRGSAIEVLGKKA